MAKKRISTVWVLIACLLIAVGGAYLFRFAAQKLGPKIGRTPFRSLTTHIASRKTNDAATASPFVAAEDWPAWRGPRGDGISQETSIATPWPAGGLKELWSAEVGLGYASPIAAYGRVYLFTLDAQHDATTCFDAGTGHILWNDESAAGYTGDFPGTRATPAIDANGLYTLGGEGELTRHDLATGKPVWRINLFANSDQQPPGYGCGSSPLLAMGKVFVQGGKNSSEDSPVACAVDKETGSIVWKSEARGNGGYAHPILAQVPDGAGGAVPQLVVFGGKTLYGMDPATGKTIWSQEWPTEYGVNSSTPVYSPTDGRLFITSDYGMGCMLLQLSPSGAAQVWKNKEIKSKFQQTILDRGVLYANSEGRLKCVNWADGKRQWEATAADAQIGDNGSIVRVGDNLLLLSDSGTLSLLHATPDGFSLLTTSRAVEGSEIWSTPLLYGGRVYVKGTQELICYDVSVK